MNSTDYVSYTCNDVWDILVGLQEELISMFCDNDNTVDDAFEIQSLIKHVFKDIKGKGTELLREGFDTAMRDWERERAEWGYEKSDLEDSIEELRKEISMFESQIREMES